MPNSETKGSEVSKNGPKEGGTGSEGSKWLRGRGRTDGQYMAELPGVHLSQGGCGRPNIIKQVLSHKMDGYINSVGIT